MNVRHVRFALAASSLACAFALPAHAGDVPLSADTAWNPSSVDDALEAPRAWIDASASPLGFDGQRLDSTADAVRPSDAPVPEPSTYAILLAGLGVVALVARRRS